MTDPFQLASAAALAGAASYPLACLMAFVLFGIASLVLKGARAKRAHDLARRALSAARPFSWGRRQPPDNTPQQATVSDDR